jgi:hypothetical protein
MPYPKPNTRPEAAPLEGQEHAPEPAGEQGFPERDDDPNQAEELERQQDA